MLSIIIPTLNEEKILAQTLEALCAISNMPHELIISDGGSTDQTRAIAKRYTDILVEDDGSHRQTIAEGKNNGAKRARGDLFLFLDADVSIPDINNFLKRAVQYFDDPKLVGLTVRLKVFPEQATFGDKIVWGIVNFLYLLQNNILHIGAASGEFQMVRASAFRKVGGYPTAFAVGEDNAFFAALSKIGRTKMATDLKVFHTSRRAHVIGWGKLLGLWMGNMLYRKFKRKSLSKEWKVIR